MARTNAALVRAILLSDYDSDTEPSLDAFIATATAMVDRVVACAILRNKTLTSEEEELIERWLAAHFYAQTDKPYSSKSTERAAGSFHGQTKMYLESTLYGQTAVRVDPSGCLSSIASGDRKVAGGFWMGKRPSQQLDYPQRD